MTQTITSGYLSGSNGSDVLTGIAQNASSTGAQSQIHIYGKAGNDTINLDFADITRFSHGHHVRGDGSGGVDDTSTNRGNDTFNFRNLYKVDHVVVGRIEDFDASRDSLSIDGNTISATELKSGSGTTGGYSWRIVEYDADNRDSATDKQQWILIDTGQGYVFYALEGARVTNGNGASNGGGQESHFIGAGGGHQVTDSELANLPTVGYVDTQNFVPAGYTAEGGTTINDDDNVYANVLTQIDGTSGGDLIAAGLNDDNVYAGGGNDHVWGGSGNDKIIGGKGNDSLYGGHDNDRLYGWGGNDRLYGETGEDALYGNGGHDTLDGGAGHDKLSGASGDDEIIGGAGADTLTGGSGADEFVFKQGHLIDWDHLSGTEAQKFDQLDVITDFELNGVDKIVLNNVPGVNSYSDLKAYATTIDGNKYFVVEVKKTNARLLVDVDDSTSWSDFFSQGNGSFNDHFEIF